MAEELNQEKQELSSTEAITEKPFIDPAKLSKLNKDIDHDLAVAEEETEREKDVQKMEKLLETLETSDK